LGVAACQQGLGQGQLGVQTWLLALQAGQGGVAVAKLGQACGQLIALGRAGNGGSVLAGLAQPQFGARPAHAMAG